jgi:hypothetical protein
VVRARPATVDGGVGRVNAIRGKPTHLRLQPDVVALVVAKRRHRFRLRLHTLLTPLLPSSLPFLSSRLVRIGLPILLCEPTGRNVPVAGDPQRYVRWLLGGWGGGPGYERQCRLAEMKVESESQSQAAPRSCTSANGCPLQIGHLSFRCANFAVDSQGSRHLAKTLAAHFSFRTRLC